ncbi:transporter substrate-binding domain-containing protein [Acidisphaera sp. L21]|uniref:transporter substrate-binding domain-containing protein n=1 Tax=Acidisphaera sp. L21 TaxID=1641851 RepID=UPI00131A8DAB|nr:transporter substrate-binding domain-containing protein [Acidisphaera sp. L21]
MMRLYCAIALLVAAAGPALAQADAAKIIAPAGVLRAAINYGNPVLAQRGSTEDDPKGVSAELARALGKQLGLPVQFVIFHEAGDVSKALPDDRWDVAFLAIDPQRATGIAFTPPYVVIEGSYVVPKASTLQATEAVDAPGIRIAVAQGSAYDLYLSRALHHATLVRAKDTAAAVAAFNAGQAEVLAGVRQPLAELAAANPSMRLLPGHFQEIEQAMGIPLTHAAGLPIVVKFVEAMKTSGFVANALAASGQTSAEVAPPARP